MATRRISAIIEARDRATPVFKRVSAGIGALGAIAGAVGVTMLAGKLVRGLKAAAEAAGVQEAAELKLARALQLSGQKASEALPALRARASALQDMTGVGDEVILSNQALLVSLGKLSGEGLDRATRAALDLAAATGTDQKTAFELVAKAATGYTGTLSRYGIILDKNLKESEKFGAALSKIEEQFGGQAQTRLQTYEGRLEELAGRWGDLQETIGGPVTEVVKEFFGSVLSPTIKNLDNAARTSDRWRNSLFDVAIAAAELGAVLEPTIKKLAGYAKVAAIIGVLKLRQFIDLQADALKALGFAADEGGSKLLELAERLRKMRDEGPKKPEETLNTLGLPTPTQVEQLTEKLKVVAPTVLTQLEAIDELAEKGAAQLELRVAQGLVRIQTLGDTVRQTLRQQGVSAALQFGDALVDAAFTGKLAFDEFFKALLRDIARAIIQALILRAILAAIGFSGGGTVSGSLGFAGGFGGGGSSATSGVARGGARAAGAADGGLVLGGLQLGRDSVPVIAQPGEAFLSRDLTDRLLALTEGGPQQVRVEMGPNMAALADRLTVEVRRGSARLEATAVAGSRSQR